MRARSAGGYEAAMGRSQEPAQGAEKHGRGRVRDSDAGDEGPGDRAAPPSLRETSAKVRAARAFSGLTGRLAENHLTIIRWS